MCFAASSRCFAQPVPQDLGTPWRPVVVLSEVGDAGPKVVKQKEGADNAADRLLWQSQARGVYKTDFESKLLTTSAEYYRSKVAGWIAACARFSQSGKPQ
ncbi:TRP1 [Symbiodinium sp. CCMP2592]|nr:TRP1 [Symbiodinium sp. CCMP2592]